MIRISSESMSSAVVMTRVAAENARCVTIILANSSARSTVEDSNVDGAIRPDPPMLASFKLNVPERSVSW